MNNEAQVMEANLGLVWNEKDPAARLKAIESIYFPDAYLYHVGEQVSGHDAINTSVTSTRKHLPPDFVFSMLRPVIVNNNIGRLIWGAGPDGHPPVATGMDVALFENGKIQSLYVFLD